MLVMAALQPRREQLAKDQMDLVVIFPALVQRLQPLPLLVVVVVAMAHLVME
jgi:hypothetical protein